MTETFGSLTELGFVMHINNSPGCFSPSVIKEKKQPGKIKVALEILEHFNLFT